VAARWKGVEGVRKRERRMRFPKNRKAPTVMKSRSFSSRGVTNEKKSATKAGSGRPGVRIRVSFVVASRRDAACASETASSERARAYRRPLPPHPPRTTRGSCPRRARTPPRLSKRIENVRGVSSSEGRERSRLAYGIRCAFFRVPETRAKKGDVRASRVRSAHLPRRLCRRCRTRLRPGTGPIR
jgi:hypothetical protein